MELKSLGVIFFTAALIGLGCSASLAQTAEPSYKADPDTYKVISEDANYRVIEVNHKKGVRDKVHGHPVSFVVVNLSDCKNRLYGADGKTVDNVSKAGTVRCFLRFPHTLRKTSATPIASKSS